MESCLEFSLLHRSLPLRIGRFLGVGEEGITQVGSDRDERDYLIFWRNKSFIKVKWTGSKHGRTNTTNKSQACTAGEFQRHCEKGLHDWLALKLTETFSLKNPKGGENIIAVPDFLNFLSQVFKGTVEEKVNCIMRVQTSHSNGRSNKITREEVAQYARCIAESYLKCSETTVNFRSWKGSQKITADVVSEFADFLLAELLYNGMASKEIISTEPKKTTYEVEELISCLSRAPLLLNLQSSVFSECFNFNKSLYVVNLIPPCLQANRRPEQEELTMLDLTQVIFINSQVPTELRQEWRYLFSTATDGESFSKMMGVILDKGSTVLIIKDDTGRVFGAFADDSWSVGPKFFGSEKCFLFHLSPKLVPYNSTSFNQNYQYLNVQQQTMPNGLGMGGKLEYFGLWVDAEFGKGKCSPSCTTFTCPQLSKNQEFNIQALEVWGIGPEPIKEEGQRDSKSVLDKDPEARAILELMNKAPVSEGQREKKKAYEEDDDD
ncbi:unnamed protein product [Allacma fusca]|uniref:MTOR-associated protein MEAK7 n=1 Tax=Allacma fusca TaxID=39272 RepID=A0A8J2KI27_9HEXA|nr:unnamed protein product [Allacma fusca]